MSSHKMWLREKVYPDLRYIFSHNHFWIITTSKNIFSLFLHISTWKVSGRWDIISWYIETITVFNSDIKWYCFTLLFKSYYLVYYAIFSFLRDARNKKESIFRDFRRTLRNISLNLLKYMLFVTAMFLINYKLLIK